ncbi:ABC transporter ATP-binding protein [Lentibacillus saliphilus]|uniref:ABC transporter ATP-binding protein n=1 Tax=Lentibacillus saliphilus TaxID=2737028 RepID=UPI001C3071C3|nr:ABC transporter ATP-binding protein [Lentibacillus saliphilus]
MGKLVVDAVTKAFGKQSVLKNVSLTVDEGEFVSVLGPSGSGKSTLFHVIGGLIEPDDGHIYLDGLQVTGQKGVISYMPQSHALFPWRTVWHNVLLGAEIHGTPDETAARAMIAKAGLSEYEQAYPHELSGGMKQRVAFIRSLLSPQSLICLDEPFSALDELTRLDMQLWLLSIWQTDRRSILFVTHNIEEAILLSDRVVVLSDKPAAVKAEFTIPFERPRRREMLLTDTCLALKKQIYKELGDADDQTTH